MTPMEIFDLSGKRALVTGGATGIGREIARTFTDAGAEVVIAGNVESDLAETASEIGCHAIPALLGTHEAADELFRATIDEMGGVDILVSNAGVEGGTTGVVGLDEAEYMRTFDVNLHAATWLSSAVIPEMSRSGGGSIILMSSLSALRGNKAIATYSMTKAALAQLARNIAVAHGPENIRANAIAPGLIKTPFSEGLIADEAFMKRRLQATPLRRFGEVSEIAATALWLASPGGAFVTGQTIVVDGGTLVHDGS
ncbi:SDR family NAD(P)-dependent oxidoreductase [Maritimibacter dapengensis]|uniref:Glucose 1-dehydrogenase n=1 Tax=Maritimibacter dapengensis TaxID=2836868 RepID=A0ABS6T5S1_9RHOB|nr:glucose 1-dehydrogenase [Maritimibacter dapengensis]MBV7380623.1 glucose 1-dehydrogenase [Maritimibacter dapengensis]